MLKILTAGSVNCTFGTKVYYFFIDALSLFGHVARLDPGVPAHDALRLMVDIYEGRKPIASCRKPPGRPSNVWLNKVQEDANTLPLSTLWRSETARGSWSGATVHSDYSTTIMMNKILPRRLSRSLKVMEDDTGRSRVGDVTSY